MKPLTLFLLCWVPLLAVAQGTPAQAPVPPSPTAPQEQALQPPGPGRFKALFQPFRTDVAALSPDGKYLAYSLREEAVVSVVVVEIDHPEKITARVQVLDDEGATPMMVLNQREKTPARINWMRWTTGNRLAVEINRVFVRNPTGDAWQSWRGAVIAFDADGTNARLIASPDDLPEFSLDHAGDNSFSTRRDAPSGFSNRVRGVDQPTAPAGASSESPASFLAPLEFDPGEAPPPANVISSQPRTFRVFDLDPHDPASVTLIATGPPRAAGSHSVALFSLNTLNGKLKSLTEDLVNNTEDALLDRQGRVRLTLPNSSLSKFPFRYKYLGAKGQNRAKPLDEVSGVAGFSVSPQNYFGERSIPLGFDKDPDLLYYASNVGRDTFGIYSINLSTKQRGKLAMENPGYDLVGPPRAGFPDQSAFVFDRFSHALVGLRYENALRTTAWLRPELQAMQTEFEKLFPGRSVEISDWDEAGKRFVVSTEGPADPGAFFIFDRETNKLLEFVRRAPWIDAHQVHLTLPFSYATQDGGRISGLVTAPKQPRLKPIPMVILCPDAPWQRVSSSFQTEVQALADMGFVVVQLNGRGAWGFGLKQRQSLTTGYDLVQIQDIVETIGALEKRFHVNPRRVALLGRGHGGFIALRALQTYPEKFRCAIALDAPVNLGDWLAAERWSDDRQIQTQLRSAWLGDEARLKAEPLTSQPAAITKPVLMLNYPGLDGEIRNPSYVAARRFAEKVKARGTSVQFDDLRTDYMNGLPAARAEVFDRIEEFINLNIYDFNVKLDELEIIK